MRLFLTYVLAQIAAAAPAVEQVWITGTGLGGEMAVSWATSGAGAAEETVRYGLSSTSLSRSATGTSEVLTDSMTTPLRVHVATLTDLPENTRIFYSPGDSSDVFNFTAAHRRIGGTVYAIFGDLGLADDYSLDALLAEAATENFDAVIFAGDFAYNFEDNGGKVGNDFMNGMQPIVSRVALFPVAGNHETMSDDSFSHYKARMAAARSLGANSGNAGDNGARWYSFDSPDGLVHWIAVDTELYSYGTKKEIAAQAAWLAADVASINRTRTPWVLAQGHKGYWESPKTDWAALGIDAAFAEANVDVYFTGHTHNYQRGRPFVNEAASDRACYTAGPPAVYKDCKGTVGILAGSPGMSQGIGTRLMPSDIALVDIQAWGYGHLTVCNETHLHWQWFQTATAEGPVPWGAAPLSASDEAWIVRTAA